MKLGLNTEDIKAIRATDVIYYVDYHTHWYKILICNQTANYVTKKLFPDSYEGKFVNEAWVCFDETLTEFSQPEMMVRVEENKSFYYYPVLEDNLKIWMRELLLPEINKISKLTSEEREDYFLKHSPSNRFFNGKE